MSPIRQSFSRHWFAEKSRSVRAWRPAFRPRVLWNTIRSAWPFWLAIAAPPVALMVGRFLTQTQEDAYRYGGTFLQLGGLGLVAHGLAKLRKDFERKTFGESVRDFFSGVANAFRPAQSTNIQTITGTGRSSASAHLEGIGTVGHTSLEDRVIHLEARLGELTQKVDTTSQELRTTIQEAVRKAAEETSTLRREVVSVKAQLDQVSVGGLHLERIGLFWLVLGTLGTSVPELLAKGR